MYSGRISVICERRYNWTDTFPEVNKEGRSPSPKPWNLVDRFVKFSILINIMKFEYCPRLIS
jgi:hypothetical protein